MARHLSQFALASFFLVLYASLFLKGNELVPLSSPFFFRRVVSPAKRRARRPKVASAPLQRAPTAKAVCEDEVKRE